MSSVILTDGKGDFVKRVHPDGTEEQVCICGWNADFSRQGCMGQIYTLSQMEEIIQNKGQYPKDSYLKHKSEDKHDGRCVYCYAFRKNSKNVFPREVTNTTRRQFEEIRPKVVRLGKLTEPGHPLYFRTLVDFLSLCKEFETSVILTTKALPFGLNNVPNEYMRQHAKQLGMGSGADLAKRLSDVHTSLMYSLGGDKFEPGLVSQGFTNAWRIEQAKNFRETGVNVSLTLVCEVYKSFNDNAKSGIVIEEALALRKEGFNIRILPIRLYRNETAIQLTGKPLSCLRSQGYFQTQDLFGFQEGVSAPYYSERNHIGIAASIHPDFLYLRDREGVGFCGLAAWHEHCDMCNMFGNKRIVFSTSELPKRDFDKSKVFRPGKNTKGQLDFLSQNKK